MTTTSNRPETNAHGLVHRHGCDAPRPDTLPTRMAGWHFKRCPTCGAAKLERVSR